MRVWSCDTSGFSSHCMLDFPEKSKWKGKEILETRLRGDMHPDQNVYKYSLFNFINNNFPRVLTYGMIDSENSLRWMVASEPCLGSITCFYWPWPSKSACTDEKQTIFLSLQDTWIGNKEKKIRDRAPKIFENLNAALRFGFYRWAPVSFNINMSKNTKKMVAMKSMFLVLIGRKLQMLMFRARNCISW